MKKIFLSLMILTCFLYAEYDIEEQCVNIKTIQLFDKIMKDNEPCLQLSNEQGIKSILDSIFENVVYYGSNKLRKINDKMIINNPFRAKEILKDIDETAKYYILGLIKFNKDLQKIDRKTYVLLSLEERTINLLEEYDRLYKTIFNKIEKQIELERKAYSK